MKWTLNEAKYGDIVRVKLGDIYHYGIFVSDEEVIQFGLPPTDLRRDSSKVEVVSSSIDAFLCGKFLEVGKIERKDKKRKKPKDVVALAKSRLGEKGYHIIYNNCEHFAHECYFGEKKCSQVERVREMWKNMPFVNIYVKKYPFDTLNNDIFPKERQKDIDKCTNEEVKKERFYVWKLLEHGLKHSLGLNIKDVELKKHGNKWICDKCAISLTHGDGVVGVAIARNDVGVDIEKIDVERFDKLPKEKIMTKKEVLEYKNLQKNQINLLLNKLWTIKEAAFKAGKDKSFSPTKIDAQDHSYITKKLCIEGDEFYLSVVSKDVSLVKFHMGEDIEIIE